MREEANRRAARERMAKQEMEDLQAAIEASKEINHPEQDQPKPKKRQRLEPPAKKPAMSRAAKRLETCPGVKETSASGKIMRPIPDLWKVKQEPLRDIKLEDLAAQANARWSADGPTAGLLGHDSTFSFSPLRLRDGKFSSFRNFFDGITLMILCGVRNSVIQGSSC